jgi:hypothetical protein
MVRSFSSTLASPYFHNPQLQGTYSIHEDFQAKGYSAKFVASDDASLLHAIDPSLVDLHAQLNRCHCITKSNITNTQEVPIRHTFVSHERHTKVTADSLADNFCIGPEHAKNTLQVTTQRGVDLAILPITHQYRADRYLTMKHLNGEFATDTAFTTAKSLRGNIASQIYSYKCCFKMMYHLRLVDGESIGHTLGDFANDFGAHEHLTFDGEPVQIGSKTRSMDLI